MKYNWNTLNKNNRNVFDQQLTKTKSKINDMESKLLMFCNSTFKTKMNYEKRIETVLINNFTNINNNKRTITSHIN